jgi:hypothetical protein
LTATIAVLPSGSVNSLSPFTLLEPGGPPR